MDINIVNIIPQEDIGYILNLINNDIYFRLDSIGGGSQGEVFKYKNYAIKIYEFGSDGEILEKLQDNPLFPKLYFYGEEFMVTEYLDIKNAYDYFERNVDINIKAIDIFKYCFSKGYIPFDMHDENVVVTKNDELKIIDVGAFIKIYGDINILDFKVDLNELDEIINFIQKPKVAI